MTDPTQPLILLVEDDIRLCDLISTYLSQRGFQITLDREGRNVASLVSQSPPNLIILDIGLPGDDGFTICKNVRTFSDVPILILTARDENIDQIVGLELGADDYVVKPVEPRVLLARIKALLRRGSSAGTAMTEISIGALVINLDARSVTLDGDAIDLSTNEFDLLSTLCKQPGKVLSREYLFQALYRRPYDGIDRTLDVRVSHLRKKLGDHRESPYRIKTIWGKGYMLVKEAW